MSSVERAGAGPYPPGVASPLQAHVHPYPTRFHGAIYTRPVFRFPYVRNPHAVFKPGDFHDYYTGNPAMNGLGALQFNSRKGVFGPGGHGGGIFQTAQTMGIGQDLPTDPNIAFKDSEEAQTIAQAASSLPWGVKNATTLTFQQGLNAIISAKGLGAQITADGILGKQTCDAAAKAAAVPSIDFPGMIPAACAAGGTVTPKATPLGPTNSTSTIPATASQPTVLTASVFPSSGGTVNSSQRTFLWILGGLAVVGVGYAIYKNKKGR